MAALSDPLIPAAPRRPVLFGALLLVAALNALAPRFWGSLETGALNAAAAMFGVSAIIWFALFALVRAGFSAEAEEPLRRGDGWAAVLLLAASLAPLALFAALGLLGAGFYLYATSPRGAPARRLGLIAMALTGPVLWGPAALALLGPEIARLETLLVGGLSSLGTDDNVLIAAEGGRQFIIAGACSSVANISLAIVLVVALAQLLRIPLTRQIVPWTLLAIGLIVLFNTLRLVAIGYRPDQFEFLHHGMGRSLFATAGLIAMSAVVMIGLYRVARARA